MQIQIEVTQKYVGAEGHVKVGQRFAVSEQRARYLIEKGLAKLVKVPGPAELKPTGPDEKKTSPSLTATPSTDSPSSSAAGSETPASSSPAAPASAPPRRRRRSKLETSSDSEAAGSSEPSQ